MGTIPNNTTDTETVAEFLARGGEIKRYPYKEPREIIEEMKPEFKEIMANIDKRMGRKI